MAPLRGLSLRGEALPQVGHIRKGGPKTKNERGIEVLGKDLHYFRFVFDEAASGAADIIKALYGNEPNDVKIVLPPFSLDRVWERWNEAYVAGALVHRCDVDEGWIVYALDNAGNRVIANGVTKDGERVKCDGGPVYEYTSSKGDKVKVWCRPTGRLRVIVPELRRLAYMVLHTTSVHDVVNVTAQLSGMFTIQRTLGKSNLAGVPLILSRKPHMISTPSGANGQRARREKWLISIEPDPKWVAAGLTEWDRLALPGAPLTLEAHAGEDADADVDPDEIEEGEFVPADDVPGSESTPKFGSGAGTAGDVPDPQPPTPPDGAGGTGDFDPAQLPTNKREFERWVMGHGWTGGDVRAALGTALGDWLKVNVGRSVEDAAKEMRAVLTSQ